MKTLRKISALLLGAVLFSACGEKEIELISFKLDKTTVTLEAGQTATVTATPMPSDATVDLKWESDNNSVATVVKTDKLSATITAVGNGTATITVSSGIATPKTVTVTVGGGTSGAGTEANPFTTETFIAAYNANPAIDGVWLTGYIVGYVDGISFSGATLGVPAAAETEILIGASASATDGFIPVQLPAGTVRIGLELFANPSNLGKQVKLYGNLGKYFGVAGLLNTSYYELEGGTTGGTKPVVTTDAILNETLLTATSFAKFTAVSVSGAEIWTHSTTYGAMMSGFTDGASHTNEDWFISPAMDLSAVANPVLSFDHARGNASVMNVGIAEGWYKVYATDNYTDDVATTTWTEITGVTHGTVAWGFVSSGQLAIPAAAKSATTRIAWKYVCSDSESATWEIKNVLIK